MKKNIIITGNPRSGKSTLLSHLLADIDNKVGFVTHEMREDNQRIGFFIETHTGETSVLASTKFRTMYSVSKYFVEPSNLDAILPSVKRFSDSDTLYLDEVGQMELFSIGFKQLAQEYLDSTNICIMTVSKVYSDEFTQSIFRRDDVIIIDLREENRQASERYLQDLYRKIQKARMYVQEPDRFSLKKDIALVQSEHGQRTLQKINDSWVCDCEFFAEHKICSHLIALEELVSAE